MLSEHQWLRWPVPGSSALRDSLWTFYWGLRLRWTPERGFASLLKRLTIDQSQRTQSLDDTASLDLLNRWDAEIPLAFSKLPSAQQQTYRATLLKQINGPERDLYSQRLFIQTHQRELNQLAADLATLQNEGDAKRSGLILAVDRFYESLGFQTGPERGGYSFGHVLNLIEPSQTWIRQKTPFLRSANHLFFFGSFPNGRAHWLQSSDQLNWQHSDLDVTFSHHQEFSQAGLRGESWVFTSEPQSQRRRDLLELEQNLGAVLGIDSFTPGRLLAPMSGVSPDQLTRMKTPEPGSLYPTLASPLSLEVGPRQAWLYLHYLPPGAREPQTFRFEVPNE